MNAEPRRGRRTVNLALAVFGALCIALAVLVLAGQRDWGWLAESYIWPAVLLGLGGVVLAATLWPVERRAPTMTPSPPVPSPPVPTPSPAEGRDAGAA